MRTKIKAVAPVTEKTVVDAPLVAMIKNSTIPDVLAQHLEAWKLLGNKWLSCMEAGLELDAKNMDIDGGIQIDAVRALVFMGYMVRSESTFQNGWLITYKLSKEGLKAVKMEDQSETHTATKSVEVECPVCDGVGQNDAGGLCTRCSGAGVVKPGKPAAKRPLEAIKPIPVKPAAPVSRPVKPVMVDCAECEGSGMTGNRKCKGCSGMGEVEQKVINPTPTRGTAIKVGSAKFNNHPVSKSNAKSWEAVQPKSKMTVRRK